MDEAKALKNIFFKKRGGAQSTYRSISCGDRYAVLTPNLNSPACKYTMTGNSASSSATEEEEEEVVLAVEGGGEGTGLAGEYTFKYKPGHPKVAATQKLPPTSFVMYHNNTRGQRRERRGGGWEGRV